MSMTLFTGARLTTGLLEQDTGGPVQPKISLLAVAAGTCELLGFLNAAT